MIIDRKYYLFNKNELIDYFAFSEDKGLSTREARRRLYKYGKNIIKERKQKSILSIFIDQFRDFMILVLMVAACLSLIMGELSDGIIIFAIIILNGIMGFIQEYRAERSLEALKKLASSNARVIRDGILEEINSEELVPGDLLVLKTGDRIPADSRIFSTKGIQVDESLLTGESVTVVKTDKNIYTGEVLLAEQNNMLFMGTVITKGKCRAIVVNTGMNTEMGKIAHLLEQENNKLTPLQKRLKNLGKWLVILSLLITFLIVVIGIIKGQSIYNMFMAGVSLAVAAIPEGLPAIVTLVLAIGVQKMIKNNAIVRNLQAVETLGCSTVICSDKTGTLTENQMSLKKIYLNHKMEDFELEYRNILFEKILRIGSLCSNVELKKETKRSTLNRVKNFLAINLIPDMLGDPTEIALVKAYYEIGNSFIDLKKSYKVIGEEGFDAERKRMSVLVETPDKRKELWIKGAIEVILERCKYIEIEGIRVLIKNNDKAKILKANDAMAGDALRVLAIAYRPFRSNICDENSGKYENELTFVGLVGMIDPPRAEAFAAVSSCYRAGIRPVMITGDHSITAAVIAEELGIIENNKKVMTGDEIKKLDDKELRKKVNEIQVYARILPEDKLRIVKALRENGEIVAMTGDGVNDAPALKEADIGIAMGKEGTDVTKEVSSLILADDNFATIVKAIEEGRKIYKNIRKFIKYLLACNIGELLSIFLGIVMGLPLPLIPIQILWVNLVTDGLPALALGLDNDCDDVMNSPPREPDESIFTSGMFGHIFIEGILIGISTMMAFLLAIYRLRVDLETARTISFSTLVFSQLFFVFSCRSEEYSFWQIPLFTNMYLVLAVFISILMQLAVIYLPLFSKYFNTKVLSFEQWLLVLILSSWSTVIVDLIRGFIKRNNMNQK